MPQKAQQTGHSKPFIRDWNLVDGSDIPRARFVI
jgi:hypothetical protein